MSWGFSPPGNAGQVAVGDSLVFVADDEGNLYGVDPTDGRAVWSQSFEHPVGTHRAFDGTLVVTADGALYAFTGKMYLHGQEFEIHRLDPASGDVQWTQSPGVDNHHLYCIDNSSEALLVGSQNDMLGDWSDPALCIDAKTGERHWQTSGGDADSGVLGDQRAYIGSYAGVTAIDREAGIRSWRRNIPGPIPIFLHDENLYVGSNEYDQSKAMALDPETGETRWIFDEWTITSVNHDSDVGGPFVGGERIARLGREGNTIWTNDAGGLFAETPIENGTLYGLTDSRVFGLDTESGDETFAYNPDWKYPRPVSVSDETVIVTAGRSPNVGGVTTSGIEIWMAEFDADRVRAIDVAGGRVAVSAGGAVYGRLIRG